MISTIEVKVAWPGQEVGSLIVFDNGSYQRLHAPHVSGRDRQSRSPGSCRGREPEAKATRPRNANWPRLPGIQEAGASEFSSVTWSCPGRDSSTFGGGDGLVNVDEQIERVDRLQKASRQRGGDSTAVVSWLGYDAPETDASMATTGRADPAGGDLRSFTHGLRESHQGERAHMTVLGHSYGSTVVGVGASHGGGLDADAVVVVGSPGMAVDRAKDLNMDPR
ncbi:alpha/beta hydrolase family protein [Streptomyces decoyicus]